MRRHKKFISVLVGLITLTAVVWWFSARTPAPSAKESLAAKVPVARVDAAVASATAISAHAAQPEPAPAATAAASALPAASAPSLASSQAAGPDVRPVPTAADAANRKTEMLATAQMYAAHASLRTPEVADPDSAGNRQILQAMVTKALIRPASAPPSRP